MSYQVQNKRLINRKSYKILKSQPSDSETSTLSLNSTKPTTNSPSMLSSRSKKKIFSFSKKLDKKSVMRSQNSRSPKACSKRESPKSPSVVSQSTPNLSEVVRSVKMTSDSLYSEHLFQTFQAMKFMRALRQPTMDEIEAKTVHLPKRKDGKKTVVFDLDETLVHCVEDPTAGQVPITVTFPSGQQIQASINIRPYAREILHSASKEFEVIVFTASHQCYADQVLDILDPKRELIQQRLYRNSCVVIDGVHIKDLRILANRKISDLVIVDNAAYSFAYQLFNGIPIISWYQDPTDRELFKLIDYLQILARSPDIRVVNKQTFRLNTFYEDYLAEISRSKEN